MPDFFPRQEGALLSWGANFTGRLPPMVPRFGIPQQLVDDCIAAFGRFSDLMRLRTDPAMLTPPVTREKNNAIAQFKELARPIAGMLRCQSQLSSSERTELGLRPRAQRRKQVPQPTAAPCLTVMDCRRGVVEAAVFDAENSMRSARPANTECVMVLFQKGERPVPNQWHLLKTSGRRRLRLELPPGIKPGERIWLTACWIGTRKQLSLLAAPVGVHVLPRFVQHPPAQRAAA